MATKTQAELDLENAKVRQLQEKIEELARRKNIADAEKEKQKQKEKQK